MSSIASINKALYRQLKSGVQYNRYFGNVSCKSTFLGEGKTSFGLHQMKQWVLKYQNQTKKIANVLKGKTVPETILNIKIFLYDHIQYNADGWDQNLRSPNCSWKTRQTGIDCKSFSVFAMSILINLGIKNIKFRKITQPTSPDKFSHVYVVVVYQNKEYIIDATVPYNYEPAKVKQEDLIMERNLPYYGLNAVQQTALVNKKTYKVATALENLQNWLDALENKGVSKNTTDAIWNEINSYLRIGKEPKITITNSSIRIENKTISFGVGLNGVGMGFIDPATIGVVSSIFSSDVFSNIFGGESMESVVSRTNEAIINPMRNHIKKKLSSANQSNAHLIATDLDKYLNVYLANEKYWLARSKSAASKKGSEEVIAVFEGLLKDLRKSFQQYGYNQQTGALSYTNFKNNKSMNYTVSYYDYKPVSALPNTSSIGNSVNTSLSTNPIKNSNTNNLSNLITTVEGLFKDRVTGETYTPEQVQQMRVQNAQGNLDNNTTKGLSTTAKVGLGVAGLLLAVVVAKKTNII
ncbi:transglutaminase-like domain-containing protein [Polaribacter aestuariivivens]|uniref:transglutaminase-like domain-containing protein n=1 Tax=Polaribacter aestuariivivens TaxID=2304626 RepID=UPI003F492611